MGEGVGGWGLARRNRHVHDRPRWRRSRDREEILSRTGCGLFAERESLIDKKKIKLRFVDLKLKLCYRRRAENGAPASVACTHADIAADLWSCRDGTLAQDLDR